MVGEKGNNYIEGEVQNTISNYYLIQTKGRGMISLVRNEFTIKKDPLREHLGAYAKLLLEVLNDGTPELDIRIVQLTQASAREQFEKCYADLLDKGRVSIPENLSDITPPTINLSEYSVSPSRATPAQPQSSTTVVPSSKSNGSGHHLPHP